MKIVFKDMKNGEIKVVPENMDDIWHLYNIVEEGDLVRAVTFRTDDKSSDDQIRSKKTQKKRMKLGIHVTEVKFHEFSDRLRIHGKIVEGPQDLGSFHTINITSEDMNGFSIVKKEWKNHDLDRLEEAVRLRSEPIVVFVSLDEETATIAVLRQSGIQKIADIDSHKSGKMYEDEGKTKPGEYFGEIIKIVKNCMTSDSTLVVVGPGFTREHFVKYGRDKHTDLFKKCHIHSTGNEGMNGIQEAIKTGIVDQITKENRVVFETNLVEKLFSEIKKNGLATYGMKEVKNALLNGAVERLLIIDVLVRSKDGENLLEISKKNNSDFTIINSMNDAGKKLEGIGGVAALLRFKI